jgi:hypothetical protein
MTSPEERATLQDLIIEATTAGARQARACAVQGLSARTVQRWQGGGPEAVDGRTLRHHDAAHKLSADQRPDQTDNFEPIRRDHRQEQKPPNSIVEATSSLKIFERGLAPMAHADRRGSRRCQTRAGTDVPH